MSVLLVMAMSFRIVDEIPFCVRTKHGKMVVFKEDGWLYQCDATLGMWLKLKRINK